MSGSRSELFGEIYKVTEAQHAHASEICLWIFALESYRLPLFCDPLFQGGVRLEKGPELEKLHFMLEISIIEWLGPHFLHFKCQLLVADNLAKTYRHGLNELSVKIWFNLFYSHNFCAARVYIEPQIL